MTEGSARRQPSVAGEPGAVALPTRDRSTQLEMNERGKDIHLDSRSDAAGSGGGRKSAGSAKSGSS